MTAVKIHVYEIYGGIKVSGSRNDPRMVDTSNEVTSVGNILEFL